MSWTSVLTVTCSMLSSILATVWRVLLLLCLPPCDAFCWLPQLLPLLVHLLLLLPLLLLPRADTGAAVPATADLAAE
jgi:hypothetical protein